MSNNHTAVTKRAARHLTPSAVLAVAGVKAKPFGARRMSVALFDSARP